MGNLLSAQTVGIVGYGRIGSKVAQLLRLFGAKFDLVISIMTLDHLPNPLETSITMKHF
jgi:phosphoglycerate dehydrogenase-like enzyme